MSTRAGTGVKVTASACDSPGEVVARSEASWEASTRQCVDGRDLFQGTIMLRRRPAAAPRPGQDSYPGKRYRIQRYVAGDAARVTTAKYALHGRTVSAYKSKKREQAR